MLKIRQERLKKLEFFMSIIPHVAELVLFCATSVLVISKSEALHWHSEAADV
jgi:hypothetical protein